MYNQSPFFVPNYSQTTMTLFTINNKDYTHKELNLIRDFFTDDQWNIIDYALDEYKQSKGQNP